MFTKGESDDDNAYKFLKETIEELPSLNQYHIVRERIK